MTYQAGYYYDMTYIAGSRGSGPAAAAVFKCFLLILYPPRLTDRAKMLMSHSAGQNAFPQYIEPHIQIKILQDDKLDLLARLSQMASRTELLAARAEASSRQGEVQVLEQQVLKQRQTIDGLNERLNLLQEENGKLSVAIEVNIALSVTFA